MDKKLCEGCACFLHPSDTFEVEDGILICGDCKDLDEIYSTEESKTELPEFTKTAA